MPKKRTDKCPYLSPTTGEPCSVNQYVAEILCLRYCKKFKLGDPSFKFWNKEYQKKYKSEIIAVSRAITQFGQNVVLEFISKNPNIYSFGYFHVKQFIIDALSKIVINNIDKEKISSLLSVEIESSKVFEVEDFVLPEVPEKKSLFNKLK